MYTCVAASWAVYKHAFPPAQLLSKCLYRAKELGNTVITMTPLCKAPTWLDTLQGKDREGLIELDSTNDTCRMRQGAHLPRL